MAGKKATQNQTYFDVINMNISDLDWFSSIMILSIYTSRFKDSIIQSIYLAVSNEFFFSNKKYVHAYGLSVPRVVTSELKEVIPYLETQKTKMLI